jgi:hypothetical protein
MSENINGKYDSVWVTPLEVKVHESSQPDLNSGFCTQVLAYTTTMSII